MQLFSFIFSFLYVRNWYTGERELSRPRVALFCSMLLLILIGVAIAYVMQTPVSYEAPVVPLE